MSRAEEAYLRREAAKAKLKLLNKTEREVIALHEQIRRSIGSLEQYRREEWSAAEWGKKNALVAKLKAKRLLAPTPEKLAEIRRHLLEQIVWENA
ncbi:hypothetical protein ACRBEV_25695 [Methylobacterium phyllosphaerae]